MGARIIDDPNMPVGVSPAAKDILRPDYRILIYQRDESRLLAGYLRLFGFTPVLAEADNLIAKIHSLDWDLCILDWFDGPDGFRPLIALRGLDMMKPCIYLSDAVPGPGRNYARIITAFKIGADDYITKPYNMDEAVWRIKALLRRTGIKRSDQTSYEIGPWTFNIQQRTLTKGKLTVRILPLECKLLQMLALYKNSYIPKPVISRELYGPDESFDDNAKAIKTRLDMLRKIFKDEPYIKIYWTAKGVGLAIEDWGELM